MKFKATEIVLTQSPVSILSPSTLCLSGFLCHERAMSPARSLDHARAMVRRPRRGRDGPAVHGDGGGSMGESTPNRGDRLFSLAVSFVLPSFSLSLLVASSLRERAPTSVFPPSFSHAAPVVRTRASREVVE